MLSFCDKGHIMIITIDGPAAAGKGTLATYLSKKYHLSYFDTGMVYRAVGIEMLDKKEDINNEQAAEQIARNLTFLKMLELSTHPEFRGPQGGKNASIVSSYPSVRQALLKMQRDFAQNPVLTDGSRASGVVYDGRDTGTVVCPNADIKLYITASSEVRAERRYKEFQAKGIKISYEDVLSDVKARDDRDSKRSASPLKPAPDAIIIDTSYLNIQEVIEKVCKIIDSQVKKS